MRFAILGTDPDIVALVVAARSLGHEVVWLGDVRATEASAIAKLTPNVMPSPDWETLLDHATAEAVLIGQGIASSELRAEQLKRLATDAVPLLVVHPVSESVLTYYEVDMIRRETRCLVCHYNPPIGVPAIKQIASWVRDGHPVAGPIHQIACERYAEDSRRETVLHHLARDVELLATVAGDIRTVSAVGPQTENQSYASLQVQLTAANLASLRWSVTPNAAEAGSIKITLVGDRGNFTLTISDWGAEIGEVTWQLEDALSGQRREASVEQFDAAATAINQLAAAVSHTDPQHRAAASTWDKATRTMEVVDAIELSLQKERAIEVHQQHLTEQLAFRGTMAAIGCGLLLAGLAVLMLAAVMGGVETILQQKLVPFWPLILLAALSVFLLLQAIPLMVSKKIRDDNPATSDEVSVD
jgi:predicted dehydrogenase